MRQLNGVWHVAWIAPVVLGLVLLGFGAFIVNEGVAAKNLVRNELRAEQITTSDDAAIPGVLVEDAATAGAQEDILTEHTLGRYGPYSGMEKDDPNRETYVTGVTLRTALNLAVMGFKVSDLVIGIGALVIVLGAINILLLAPVMYAVANKAAEPRRAPVREREMVPAAGVPAG
jgi:hypothetical protein